jgi:hypothetical protein
MRSFSMKALAHESSCGQSLTPGAGGELDVVVLATRISRRASAKADLVAAVGGDLRVV